MTQYIFSALLAILILILLSSYKSLLAKRNNAKAALVWIDSYLQKRIKLLGDLFPQLEEAVEPESEVFYALAKIQAEHQELAEDYPTSKMISPAGIVRSDIILDQIFAELDAMSAEHPELGIQAPVIAVTAERAVMRADIATVRREYTKNLTAYRKGLHGFPGAIVAGLFGLSPGEMILHDIVNPE